MPSDYPELLSVEEAKEELDRKGWKINTLAKWWGVSTVYVSRIVNDKDRKRHWDDSLRGLPRCPKSLR